MRKHPDRQQPDRHPDRSAWRAYVRQIAAGERQIDVAERTGIDQGTISKWMRDCGDPPQPPPSVSPPNIRAFAHAYGRPILEALVAAGIITKAEAGLDAIQPADWREVASDDALLEELRRRIDRGGRRGTDSGQ